MTHCAATAGNAEGQSHGGRPRRNLVSGAAMAVQVRSKVRDERAQRPTLAPRRFQPALTLGHQMDLLALAEDARHRDAPGVAGLIGYAIGVAEARRATLAGAGVSVAELRPT